MVIYCKFLYLLDQIFLLSSDNLVDHRVSDGWMNQTLHHSASFIVFNVSSRPLEGHPIVFAEALLFKVAQSQIVSISHKVLHFPSLHLF